MYFSFILIANEWKEPQMDWLCLGWTALIRTSNGSFPSSVIELVPSGTCPAWPRSPLLILIETNLNISSLITGTRKARWVSNADFNQKTNCQNIDLNEGIEEFAQKNYRKSPFKVSLFDLQFNLQDIHAFRHLSAILLLKLNLFCTSPIVNMDHIKYKTSMFYQTAILSKDNFTI